MSELKEDEINEYSNTRCIECTANMKEGACIDGPFCSNTEDQLIDNSDCYIEWKRKCDEVNFYEGLSRAEKNVKNNSFENFKFFISENRDNLKINNWFSFLVGNAKSKHDLNMSLSGSSIMKKENRKCERLFLDWRKSSLDRFYANLK